MLPVVMVFFVIGSIIESAAYWLFNYKVLDKLFMAVIFFPSYLRSTLGRKC